TGWQPVVRAARLAAPTEEEPPMSDDSSSQVNPFDVLAEEFLARHRRGDKPSVSDYAARYPELADDIRDLFPRLLLMEDVRPGAGEVTGPVAGGAGQPGAARRLRHRARGWAGWHGRGLRGRAAVAGPARRPQGAARQHADEPDLPGAVPPRGQGGG